MNGYSLSQLDDDTLMRQLHALVAGERAATAVILAHIAEVDLRRLYLPAAYSSMYAYCVGALKLAEGAAYRRVRSARAARRFPQLYDEIASGRLNLTTLSMLAPHLRQETLDELLAAARGRPRMELESWLAKRFPVDGPMLPPARVRVVGLVAVAVPPTPIDFETAEQPNRLFSETVNWADERPATPFESPWPPALSATEVQPSTPDAGEATTLPPRPYFLLKVALDEPTHAKLERAQVLLAHSVRAGEVARVLERALDALLAKLEYRKTAAPTSRPTQASPANGPSPAAPSLQRPPRTERTDSRGIPASIRREVWARDGGRCTFTSPTGHKCAAARGLEFDHALPVAKGGESTPENLRLRCRAHNQFEAERQFGREFMESKRSGRGGRDDPEH